MSTSSQLRDRIAAVHAEARAIGAELATHAATMSPDELFEVTGDLQRVVNTVDGAQLVAIAHAGTHELRLTDRGPVSVHHDLGFIDAMTSTEVSLATGLGQWAAGRKVGQAQALTSRFTQLLRTVLTGELATVNAAKVVTACDGLDDTACAAVDDIMATQVAGLDPARITTVTRKVATRIAADQVTTATATNRKDRLVQVTPGPDGTTDWWARLPAAASAAAWAAVRDLGDHYATNDPDLTLDQARADALVDLLLTNVTVTTNITLGIPVITGPAGQTARNTAIAEHTTSTNPTTDTSDIGAEGADTTAPDTTAPEATDIAPAAEGADTTAPDSTSATHVDINDPNWVRPPIATGGLGLGSKFSLSAALISGCEIPGIGFIDADTVEHLLTVVPTDIGRALLDAHTGTLLETTTTAYRPPKALTDFVTTRDGTCRMWGCTRPATTCDLDHARPWPAGPTTPTNLAGLCRRHHRLKQQRRWTYHLAPDGTATWTSPTGTTRTTKPDFTAPPPPPTSAPTVTTTTQPQPAAAKAPPF